ncbi:MAG: DNA polymerase/3'-5' exonuclease PolX [Verrucomicrobiae bacterium]|nr:DNA polymerase/3'-5' exonuclease PolX [Verrucomicrobiae bacterium]
MDKNAIAKMLREIGVLLDLKGENRFKSLAYANAARTLETLQEDFDVLVAQGRLGELKGIGAELSKKIAELHATGHLPYYEELKASFPTGLLDCLRIPGLGPKKVKTLWERLQIDSLGDLKLACDRGVIAGLDGFGEKTQAKILEGIANLDKYRGQFLLLEAEAAAAPLLAALRVCKAARRVEIAGSLRRRKEVVRDLDFVVATEAPNVVMDAFFAAPGAGKIVARGPTKASLLLENGMQADVRCVTPDEFPFALAYFTGSKEHNIAMRQRAIEQKLKLNEYGLFPLVEGKEKTLPCRDEADLYRALGLACVPPELREDLGEFAAAEKDALPRLVRADDLRGVFHCHTTASDGRNSLEEMARAAIALGWEYLGIADHSKTSAIAHGLDAKRLARQGKEIAALNRRLADEGIRFRVFAGSEVDILADGRLDFSDDVLAGLDFVVASIHQGFGSEEAKQTTRILRALENPHVTMLGHATGRLLLGREPLRLDLTAILEAAAKKKVVIEFNTTPSRMELDWRWWRRARDLGVMCSINPDAHSTEQLRMALDGTATASKGWLRPEDVLNTRSLAKVEKLLLRRR